MSTKHTPGPWAIGPQEKGLGFNLYSEKMGWSVAKVAPKTNWYVDGEPTVNPADMQDHPDAQLIAAAPDLLEALTRIKEWMSKKEWEDLVLNIFSDRLTESINRIMDQMSDQ